MDNTYDEIIDMDDNENENIFTLDTSRFTENSKINISDDTEEISDDTMGDPEFTPNSEPEYNTHQTVQTFTTQKSSSNISHDEDNNYSYYDTDDSFLDDEYSIFNNKRTNNEQRKLSETTKKNLAGFAAVIVLIIIPVLIFTGIKKSNTSDNLDTTNTNKATSMSFLYSDYTSVSENDSDMDYETCSSVRFDSVDDLTLYISSSAAYYLSCEKQLETKYNNNTITESELLSGMNEYIEKINNIYHLLTANENVYKSNAMTDTYEELTNEVNEVIKYGDIVVYNNIQ